MNKRELSPHQFEESIVGSYASNVGPRIFLELVGTYARVTAHPVCRGMSPPP